MWALAAAAQEEEEELGPAFSSLQQPCGVEPMGAGSSGWLEVWRGWLGLAVEEQRSSGWSMRGRVDVGWRTWGGLA